MGVGHQGAGNEVGTMNRCPVICKAGRASSPLQRQLRLFCPRHRPGLQGHHLPGDCCVQVIFDQAEAVHMIRMSEKVYIRSSNGLQNSLGVKTTLDMCELGI